jgi:hypothetical protein
MESTVISIKVHGSIYSDSEGVNSIMNFYQEANKYVDRNIELNFYDLEWFDANLFAFFEALLFKLSQENKLKFYTDFDFLYENFNIFFKNGMLKDENYYVEDKDGNTIPFEKFLPSDKEQFYNYTDTHLMNSKGMDKIPPQIKNQIKSDLYEVFQNIKKHARTDNPCFVCGQYYPDKGEFMLTMVDLGVGFLVPINEWSNGEINTDIDAIKMAVNGQSSMVKDRKTQIGGMALSGIKEYLEENQGVFQIYSGCDFWASNLEHTGFKGFRRLDAKFCGSLINMIFRVAV